MERDCFNCIAPTLYIINYFKRYYKLSEKEFKRLYSEYESGELNFVYFKDGLFEKKDNPKKETSLDLILKSFNLRNNKERKMFLIENPLILNYDNDTNFVYVNEVTELYKGKDFLSSSTVFKLYNFPEPYLKLYFSNYNLDYSEDFQIMNLEKVIEKSNN